MAVAIQSSTIGSWAGKENGGTYPISYPTGLTAGDLIMIGVCAMSVGESSLRSFAPSGGWTGAGWTTVATSNYSSTIIGAYAKIATADDVTAGSLSLVVNQGYILGKHWVMGTAFRITGSGDAASLQGVSASGVAGSYSGIDITPTFADSLYLFYIGGFSNAASGSVSNYAIATDNPTWTELFDVYGNSGGYVDASERDGLFACASATRTATSATGTASATIATFTVTRALLVIIPPKIDVSISGTTGILELVGNNGSVTGAANITGTTGIIELLGNDGAVTTPAQKWSNTNKSTAPSWSNKEKS